MQQKNPWRVMTVVLFLTAILSGCASKPSFKNQAIDPPLAAPEISLTDQNGNAFQVSAQRGKVLLLFFGFSHCQNECPTTMANIKAALAIVGDPAKDVTVAMVSTDSANDTAQSMKDFMGEFNPAFLGILGTPDQLAKTWKDYGVTVLDGGETHSSFTYVIDRKGNQRLTFSPDSTPDDIAHDVKILLAEK